MSKKVFAQFCTSLLLGALTLLVGRNMHDLGMVVVFAVCVLVTILSAFRVRNLRMRERAAALRAAQKPDVRVPQNAATETPGE